MNNSQTINRLLKEGYKPVFKDGYRPVARLYLFDSNLIIIPTDAGDADAGWTDGEKNLAIQKMERQDLNGDCISKLYAREHQDTLQLVAEFERNGQLRFSSYKGRYEIFWDFEQQEGGESE